MKTCPKLGVAWTRGRFFAVTGALFALQVGLIFLFGEHSPARAMSKPPMAQSRVLEASVHEDQLLSQFFVGDPAAFSLPGRHGFSGRGWLNQRPLDYQDDNQLEAPEWLALDTARLGTNFPFRRQDSEAMAWDPDDHQDARVDSLPDFLPAGTIRTNSVFRLEGGLADRLLAGTPALGAKPGEKVLANSVVQIAVDSGGEVVAARLDSSCGSAEVDAEAVAKALTLRFRPQSSPAAQWGEAIFQWQTTEPVAAAPSK